MKNNRKGNAGMRITYEHELEELNKCLRDMAMMVEKAIEQTFVAFEDQNYTMAEDVIKGDRNVNDMERAIESRCLSLILRQQPVAKTCARYLQPLRW